MPTLSRTAGPAADAQAVEAVRSGDRERFQELVERHADKVFAIAWSRLGDRDLAEEATQQAFIAAYRRLALLGKAEKFGAWIAAIVRNAAINLGLRRRSESRKRFLWGLEQDPSTERPCGEDLSAAETLRESLEELSPIHRECLVLFYLENRSVADASERLGISQSAFKVRLHRARSVLREALEERLESNLDRLKAPARLSQAIMLALPGPPSGMLATGGLLSAIAKGLPFTAVVFLFQVVTIIPGALFARWLGEKDLRNFRDASGFRVHLYQRFLRGMLLFVVVFTLAIHLASAGLGLRTFATLMGAFVLLNGLVHLRGLRFLRHPLHWAATSGLFLIGLPLLGVGALDWPISSLLIAQGLFFLLMSWALPRAPMRMDHSLFTRAAQNLFPVSVPLAEAPAGPPRAFPREANEQFIRFLGAQLLVEDWRRVSGGFELRLARVVTQVLASAFPLYWGGTSRALLHPDGRVEARLGEDDRRELLRHASPSRPLPSDLEARVAHALRQSREALLSHRSHEARTILGEQPETEVFLTAPVRSAAMRTRVWLLRAAAILLPLIGVLQSINGRVSPAPPPPVDLKEADVRAFLNELAADRTNLAVRSQFDFALSTAAILPPREWVPDAFLQALPTNLLGGFSAEDSHGPSRPSDALWALASQRLIRAAGFGLLTPADLRPHLLDPASLRSALEQLPRHARAPLVELRELEVHNQPYRILDTRDLADRIRFLDQWSCLDLFDLSSIVEPLVASQILEGHPFPPRSPVSNHQQVQGLFHTRFGQYLVDTRDSLYLLSKAQALDRIDREACLSGLLRLHRGRGLFLPPTPKPGRLGLAERPSAEPWLGGPVPASRDSATLDQSLNFLHGEASDTWFAFESFRILAALDRVSDLQEWQFRPSPGDFIVTPEGHRSRTWSSIEAWLLQDALSRFLTFTPPGQAESRKGF